MAYAATRGRLRPIAGIIDSFGIPVRTVSRDCKILGEAYGKTIVRENGKITILISDRLPIEEQRLTLAHEFAHLLLGHLLPRECYRVPGKQAEFEAETLGFILYNFLYGTNGGRENSI